MSTAQGSNGVDQAAHRWSGLLEPLATLWRAVGVGCLWVLCSIPVITAGAATVALLAVARDDLRHHQRPVLRSYLAYLRQNAALGTFVLLVTAGPVAGLVVLGRLPSGPLVGAATVAAVVGSIAAVPLIAHGCALVAHAHHTPRSLYRAAVLMTLAKPAASLLSLGVVAALVGVSLFWIWVLPLLAYPAARAIFSTFRRAFAQLQPEAVN